MTLLYRETRNGDLKSLERDMTKKELQETAKQNGFRVVYVLSDKNISAIKDGCYNFPHVVREWVKECR